MAPHASGDEAGHRSGSRSLLVAVGVGAAVALAMAALVYAVVAVPFYALARFTEPQQGLDRPVIRDGIRLALPIGMGVGVLVGAIVGAWYARGGHLPPPD